MNRREFLTGSAATAFLGLPLGSEAGLTSMEQQYADLVLQAVAVGRPPMAVFRSSHVTLEEYRPVEGWKELWRVTMFVPSMTVPVSDIVQTLHQEMTSFGASFGYEVGRDCRLLFERIDVEGQPYCWTHSQATLRARVLGRPELEETTDLDVVQLLIDDLGAPSVAYSLVSYSFLLLAV